MKEKLKYLLTLVVVQASLVCYACKCTHHKLSEDISNSDEVFIGTVVSNNAYSDWTFTFEAKKVYKGSLNPGENYKIIQGATSCHTNRFVYGNTYLIFARNKSVSQCNNSGRFEDNRNIVFLDSIFNGNHLSATTFQNELKEIQERYNNFIFLSNMDAAQNPVLGIKDKKVVFWDGKKCLSKPGIGESNSDFYPTRYYLEADATKSEWLKELGADYLIFVTDAHMIRNAKTGWMNNEKPKKKLINSIKAFLNI